MKYLVIGGAGFIGSHIVDKLIAKGSKVVVMDNLISGHKKHIDSKAEFEWGDIRFADDLTRVFAKHSPLDRVINLAAQPYIPKCFDDPKLFFETNANGTLNVIMACEKYKAGRLLQYASAEEYGTRKGKINEEMAIRPQSTYGVSKIAADYLISVRHRESGLVGISLRQFNCYGPRETHEYVIPEIIQQLAERVDFLQLGNVNAERDFLYVEDAAEYAIELLEQGAAGETYNLGGQICISVNDLAELIKKLMNRTFVPTVVDEARLRPWDIERLESDNTKIHSVVKYRPQTGLEEGLKKTIQYFLDNGRRWDF